MKIYKSIAKISLAIFSIYGFQVIADCQNHNAWNNRTVDTNIYSDSELKSKINDELASLEGDLQNRVELAVQDGMVIVIGYVQNEAQHNAVINAVKRVGGYIELIDKVEISSKPDTLVRDTITTGKVKAYLMRPFNGMAVGDYAVTTVNQVVYIVGTAKSEAEKKRIIDYTKSLSNVNKIVSHIKVH